jgi:hypothetical protein
MLVQEFKPSPTHQASEVASLTHKTSVRLARYLERAGLIEGDAESHYLSE